LACRQTAETRAVATVEFETFERRGLRQRAFVHDVRVGSVIEAQQKIAAAPPELKPVEQLPWRAAMCKYIP